MAQLQGIQRNCKQGRTFSNDHYKNYNGPVKLPITKPLQLVNAKAIPESSLKIPRSTTIPKQQLNQLVQPLQNLSSDQKKEKADETYFRVLNLLESTLKGSVSSSSSNSPKNVKRKLFKNINTKKIETEESFESVQPPKNRFPFSPIQPQFDSQFLTQSMDPGNILQLNKLQKLQEVNVTVSSSSCLTNSQLLIESNVNPNQVQECNRALEIMKLLDQQLNKQSTDNLLFVSAEFGKIQQDQSHQQLKEKILLKQQEVKQVIVQTQQNIDQLFNKQIPESTIKNKFSFCDDVNENRLTTLNPQQKEKSSEDISQDISQSKNITKNIKDFLQNLKQLDKQQKEEDLVQITKIPQDFSKLGSSYFGESDGSFQMVNTLTISPINSMFKLGIQSCDSRQKTINSDTPLEQYLPKEAFSKPIQQTTPNNNGIKPPLFRNLGSQKLIETEHQFIPINSQFQNNEQQAEIQNELNQGIYKDQYIIQKFEINQQNALEDVFLLQEHQNENEIKKPQSEILLKQNNEGEKEQQFIEVQNKSLQVNLSIDLSQENINEQKINLKSPQLISSKSNNRNRQSPLQDENQPQQSNSVIKKNLMINTLEPIDITPSEPFKQISQISNIQIIESDQKYKKNLGFFNFQYSFCTPFKQFNSPSCPHQSCGCLLNEILERKGSVTSQYTPARAKRRSARSYSKKKRSSHIANFKKKSEERLARIEKQLLSQKPVDQTYNMTPSLYKINELTIQPENRDYFSHQYDPESYQNPNLLAQNQYKLRAVSVASPSRDMNSLNIQNLIKSSLFGAKLDQQNNKSQPHSLELANSSTKQNQILIKSRSASQTMSECYSNKSNQLGLDFKGQLLQPPIEEDTYSYLNEQGDKSYCMEDGFDLVIKKKNKRKDLIENENQPNTDRIIQETKFFQKPEFITQPTEQTSSSNSDYLLLEPIKKALEIYAINHPEAIVTQSQKFQPPCNNTIHQKGELIIENDDSPQRSVQITKQSSNISSPSQFKNQFRKSFKQENPIYKPYLNQNNFISGKSSPQMSTYQNVIHKLTPNYSPENQSKKDTSNKHSIQTKSINYLQKPIHFKQDSRNSLSSNSSSISEFTNHLSKACVAINQLKFGREPEQNQISKTQRSKLSEDKVELIHNQKNMKSNRTNPKTSKPVDSRKQIMNTLHFENAFKKKKQNSIEIQKNFINKNKTVLNQKKKNVDPYFEFKRALNKNLEDLQIPSSSSEISQLNNQNYVAKTQSTSQNSEQDLTLYQRTIFQVQLKLKEMQQSFKK